MQTHTHQACTGLCCHLKMCKYKFCVFRWHAWSPCTTATCPWLCGHLPEIQTLLQLAGQLHFTVYYFLSGSLEVYVWAAGLQLQDMTGALPCRIHLPVCLWIMDPHSWAPTKNTNLGNEVLPQDTTHLIQRPCYQWGSLCQDPAGNWTTGRPDDHKETQTAVVWSCLPFIVSGQIHLARPSERRKKTR